MKYEVTQEDVEITLNKIFPHIKPEEVTDIMFDVRHTAPDEFTLYTSFVVDGDWWDSLDSINKAAFIHQTKMKLRRDIKNFTGINVVFDPLNTNVNGGYR
jgi:hypothetical protein